MTQPQLFAVPTGWCTAVEANNVFADRHYLGPCRRAIAYWIDEAGALAFAHPTARMIPNDGTVIELTRWCITSTEPNAGSQQWARVRRQLRHRFPDALTVVSYADTDLHDGALYRAANWTPAHTHHTFSNYPTRSGKRPNDTEHVAPKRRYLYPIRRYHPWRTQVTTDETGKQ
jgi:hypothetical protein